MFQLDASLLKNNHIPWMGEQGNLQFRFDFINLFNHVNLGTVDPFIGDGSFGKVTTALPARQPQLGVRVSFQIYVRVAGTHMECAGPFRSGLLVKTS
jgi:hypothetical protein